MQMPFCLYQVRLVSRGRPDPTSFLKEYKPLCFVRACLPPLGLDHLSSACNVTNPIPPRQAAHAGTHGTRSDARPSPVRDPANWRDASPHALATNNLFKPRSTARRDRLASQRSTIATHSRT